LRFLPARRGATFSKTIAMAAELANYFVLGVVERGGRYLLVQERDGSWYLPAGRVEAGEDLLSALARETWEEAHQDVEALGLLGIDHSPALPLPRNARWRFVFVARVRRESPPKGEPDHHSLRAGWFTPAEIERLRLRHDEVRRWIALSQSGRPLLPPEAYQFGLV
jgi:8-oxo-dGTP pyrophosphatase MutT (NUDIX family)